MIYTKEQAKQWLKDTVKDLFMDFLFQNRKYDTEMGKDQLRKLMDDGVISKELMIEVFTDQINSEY